MKCSMSLRGWRRAGRAVALGLAGLALFAGPLRAQQERGVLGVQLWCATPCEMQEANGQVIWVFRGSPVVTRVQPGSPAQKAGLQAGDTIVGIDGLDLTSEAGGRKMGSLRVGVPVALRVRRAEGEREIRVTPVPQAEVYADADLLNAPALADDWDSLNVQLRSLNREQRDFEAALRRAERLWGGRVWVTSDSQSQAAVAMRQEMDSTWRELVRSQRRVADSLAIRTLTIAPLAIRGDSTLCPVTAPTAAVSEMPPTPRSEMPAPARPLAVTILTSYLNAVAGARFETLNPDLGAYFGTTTGLLVLQVVEGTPAAVAGLRPGDVVERVNGREVSRVEDLREALAGLGGKEIQVVRKGRKLELQIRPR